MSFGYVDLFPAETPLFPLTSHTRFSPLNENSMACFCTLDSAPNRVPYGRSNIEASPQNHHLANMHSSPISSRILPLLHKLSSPPLAQVIFTSTVIHFTHSNSTPYSPRHPLSFSHTLQNFQLLPREQLERVLERKNLVLFSLVFLAL